MPYAFSLHSFIEGIDGKCSLPAPSRSEKLDHLSCYRGLSLIKNLSQKLNEALQQLRRRCGV